MRHLQPPIFTDLRAALRGAPDYAFGYALYLPADERWSLATRCALIDPDDVESDDQDDPYIAQEHGLTYGLDFGTVQEIYANLSQQAGSASDELLLRAFLHYYDNDAFIDLSHRTDL